MRDAYRADARRYVTPSQASHIIRFQFDQRVTAHAFHARILWLTGHAIRRWPSSNAPSTPLFRSVTC